MNTMDNLSDSFRGDVDSVISTDSPQLISNEFQLRHLSTPDVSNIELSKRVALLELENERLRVDLENLRIDLNARIAANQGLKGKVTELFVEMQTVLQDKQKLQNTLTDTNNRLSTAEASAKWYQSQVHILIASKKSLQVEIDTYQGILKQRQHAIADINANYKKLSIEYTKLAQQYQREKHEMQNAIKDLESHLQSIDTVQDALDENSTASPTDTSMILEATEDELRNTKAELKALEQHLLDNEIARMSMESALSRQRVLISSLEKNMQKSEIEKNDTADLLRKTQFEVQKLRSGNEMLQTSLLASKREQNQVEDAISHLRLQLTKMIAQYKLLKAKNAESEKKLSTMQDLINENKHFKTLSYKANSALLKKLKDEKVTMKNLQQKVCKQMNDKFDITKLQDRLKSLTTAADESIDEGYGDSNIYYNMNTSSILLDVASPSSVNSVLLKNAVNVLARSKNFGLSMQEELNTLRLKMETLRNQCDALNQHKSHSNNIIPFRNL